MCSRIPCSANSVVFLQEKNRMPECDQQSREEGLIDKANGKRQADSLFMEADGVWSPGFIPLREQVSQCPW